MNGQYQHKQNQAVLDLYNHLRLAGHQVALASSRRIIVNGMSVLCRLVDRRRPYLQLTNVIDTRSYPEGKKGFSFHKMEDWICRCADENQQLEDEIERERERREKAQEAARTINDDLGADSCPSTSQVFIAATEDGRLELRIRKTLTPDTARALLAAAQQILTPNSNG